MAIVDANKVNEVFLAYGGSEALGFKVQDSQGVLQFYPGVAPQIVDQQHSGPYGYDALPAEISSPLAFESWERGAGFRNIGVLDRTGSATEGLSFHGYSYSRGINASYGDRLYRSFERQEFGTPADDAPTMYLQTKNFGLMRASGVNLYTYDSGAWDLVEAFAVPITDMIEYGNSTDDYFVVALGDGHYAKYSTDGLSFSDSDKEGTYLTQAGITSTEPVLWLITSQGALRSSVTVTSFSNADIIGSASDLTTGLVTLGEIKVILKDIGLYAFNGTDIKTVIEDPTFRRADNGTKHVIWFGKLYFNYMGRIVEYDIAQDSFRTVFEAFHPEVNGAITSMSADATSLYFTVQNRAGNTYLIKMQLTGDNTNPWHTIAYLEDNDCNAMTFAAAPTVHADNPVLVFGYGETDMYFIDPRDGMLPEDDENCRFDPADGTLYGPSMDGGTLTFPKLLNGLRVVTVGMDATERVVLSYDVDEHGQWQEALTAAASGLSDVRIGVDVPYVTIAYRVVMTSGTSLSTGRVDGILIDSMPNPPRRRAWTVVVEIGPGTGTVRHTPKYREAYLIQAVGKRGRFTDYRGDDYTVLVQDAKPMGYAVVETGEASAVTAYIALVMVEI